MLLVNSVLFLVTHCESLKTVVGIGIELELSLNELELNFSIGTGIGIELFNSMETGIGIGIQKSELTPALMPVSFHE